MSSSIEALSKPVSEDLPSGENLEYDLQFQEIETLFTPREKSGYSASDEQSDIEPNWKGVEKLAAETGGVYIPVSSPGTNPNEITEAISTMERRSFDNESIDVLAERFQWPLAAAAVALVLHLTVSPLRSKRPPNRP